MGAYTLKQALSAYVASRALRKSSAAAMRYSVASVLRYLAADDVPLADVSPELLNGWLSGLGLADKTLINHRANLLALLRASCDAGRCVEPIARRIRKPRKPRPRPVAWTINELRRVVAACDSHQGRLRRAGVWIDAAAYFGCLVRVAYETGLRRANLFSLEQGQVSAAGVVYVTHNKTGAPHVCQVKVETVARLRVLPGGCPLRWADNKSFYRRMREICAAAGVPGGGLQRVRKTAATQIWLENPDSPARVQAFLGHLSGDMWRHYVDTSQGERRPPSPPAL